MDVALALLFLILGSLLCLNDLHFLDLLLKREPHYSSAVRLFSSIEKGEIIACTSPVVITNIYYISARIIGKRSALKNVRKLLSLLKVVTLDEKIMSIAIDSKFSDFEDAIQYYAARNCGIRYLITRNKSDYRVSDMTINTAEEYLKLYH